MDFDDMIPVEDSKEESKVDAPKQNMDDFLFQNDPMNQQGSSDIMSAMNSIPLNNQMESEPMEEAEIQRMEARKQEENERRKKIEEKINLELKQKEELREAARKYMEEYENKKRETISKRKEINAQNEKEFLNNKNLIKQGKKNPWETVSDNIALKESDYKGSNDISRMRQVIISRKNDQVQGGNDAMLGNII